MKLDRLRTISAWASPGLNFLLMGLDILGRMAPHRLSPTGMSRLPIDYVYVVAIIAGLFGLPRWPAIVGLGIGVLILISELLPDSFISLR
jgi:hypothetical protein